MTNSAPQPRQSRLPTRQLRLLANLAPAATVAFALITVWLVVSTLQNLALPMTSAVALSLVLGALSALLAGFVTYSLGIEVPRLLRAWESALIERMRVLGEE